MEEQTETKIETPVEKIDVLEIVGRMMKMWPAGGEAPTAERLLEDLPPEAIMGPKRDRDGNVLRTADANMTGYKPAYVIKAAVERLGAGGWIEYCTMGPEADCYLSKSAADARKPDGISISCHMIIWFPALNVFKQSIGSGAAPVRGDYERSLSDATKAAQTNARKRAMALIGIGWRGYTDDMSPDAADDDPPVLPGRPQEQKKYTPPAPSKPTAPAAQSAPAAKAPAPAAKAPAPPAPAKPTSPAKEPETFADAAKAAAEPQAPAVDPQGVEAAFQDVLELLAEDGLIAKTEKGIAWFRARAQDFGFFDQGGTEESKVKLIERMNSIHDDRLRKLHARYRAIFGEDEAGRRAWMKKVIGKDSTAACTTQERIRLLAELADLAKERT